MSYLSYLNGDLVTIATRWPRYLLYMVAAVLALVFAGSLSINPITWRAVLFTGGDEQVGAKMATALGQIGRLELVTDAGRTGRVDVLNRHAATWGVSFEQGRYVVTRNSANNQDDGSARVMTYLIVLALNDIVGESVRDTIMLDALIRDNVEVGQLPRSTATARPPEWQFLPRLIAFIVAFVPLLLAIELVNNDARSRALLIQLAARQGGFISYVWAKLTICVAFALCIFLLLLLTTRTFFGLTPKENLMLVIAAQFAAATVSAAYGLTVGVAMGPSRQVYGAIAAYFLLLTLFTGFLFPLDAAAEYIRTLSALVPLSFSLPILENWLAHGQSPLALRVEMVALATQAVCALAAMTGVAWIARRSL